MNVARLSFHHDDGLVFPAVFGAGDYLQIALGKTHHRLHIHKALFRVDRNARKNGTDFSGEIRRNFFSRRFLGRFLGRQRLDAQYGEAQCRRQPLETAVSFPCAFILAHV